MDDVTSQSFRTRSRVKTVAERNDVSVSTIWRMVRDGRLTVYRPSPGVTLIDDKEAELAFTSNAPKS